MIVPTRLERSGDACSLQTLATSGYNTSADSELSSSKSPVSPISPVSLISTSSFPYHSYEVPDADTQVSLASILILPHHFLKSRNSEYRVVCVCFKRLRRCI